MKSLVTGGTGFVGAHVVRALLQRGDAVRALVRADSPRSNLEGLEVEIVEGDLCDEGTLGAVVEGCELLFHCAADYRLGAPNPDALYRTNVEGTRAILAAASAAEVRRVVYTSSVGALGLHADGSPADENTPVELEDMIGHYKRSKFLAERVAQEWAERGLDVVIVNPSTPVGELDIKPTPTGQIILDFLEGRMPAYVDTGMNLVDVRDVAVGHLLAADRGRSGRRYILGCRNMSLREMLEHLATITGRKAPRLRLPHWIPLAAAHASERVARLTGGTPRITVEAVRMSQYRMYFDSGRAVRELGIPQSSVVAALERAVEWFREQGHG
jgi:dihydroflavonol-4-reductase